jgi:hypothetical protein
LAFGGEGYDGGTYAGRGGLKLTAAENWTTTPVRGSRWDFYGATTGQGNLDAAWMSMTNGKVGIGNTDPDNTLHVTAASSGTGTIKCNSTDDDGGSIGLYNRDSGAHADSRRWVIGCNLDADGDLNFRRSTGATAAAGTVALTINSGGNATFAGALSKGSGSFRIEHPLESRDGYDLVHSFIEGPQADLLYRGTATLSGGTATVNIDTAARLTDGTFVALVNNVQAFTTNETAFDNVRASVSGNTLTITSEDDTSTASISWLVVGERKDAHMLDTDWTDSDGRVITEPATKVSTSAEDRALEQAEAEEVEEEESE